MAATPASNKLAKAGRHPSFRIAICARFDPKVLANWLGRK